MTDEMDNVDNTELYKKLAEACGASNVKKNAPLSRCTTFKVGGPADLLVNAGNAETLKAALETAAGAGAPFYVIGRGSNLVFDDAGFKGVVIRLCDGEKRGAAGPELIEEDEEGALVYAYGGTALSAVASFACDRGLTGLEFASGIPGTVGGGVLMNAGAYGGELCQCVVKSNYIEIVKDEVNGTGTVREGALEGEAQGFSYRHSAYQDNGFIVTGAYFRLKKGRSKMDITAEMRELNRRRREKQPLELPSAGSAFKRPPGDFAGRLIEASGLKGFAVGGAQVSEKHAGFIVNRGGATAADIRALVDAVRERVFADSGVMLEPEIRFVGERG